MALNVKPLGLARQPQYPVKLSERYDSALIAGVPGLFDVTDRQPKRFGSLPIDLSSNGIGLRFDAADANTPVRRLEWSNASWNSHTGAHTLIAAFTVRTPPSRANKGIISKFLGAGDQRSWVLLVDYQTSATDVYIRTILNSTGAAAENFISPTGPAISNGNYIVVSVYRPSAFLGLWVNGKPHSATTTSVPSALFSSSADVWVGTQFSLTATNQNSVYVLTGSIQLYAVLPFAVADSEALTLSSNPWQLFRGLSVLGPPTPYPLLSNLQATRGNTSVNLSTNIRY